jgi:hypothetical protein
LIYYHPFGLLATRTFGSVSLSFALGLEDTDRLILGSKFRIGDITGAFFTDNYTSDLYSLWSARYASNMPGYWEGRLRRDGILIQIDPYKNDFGDTIHLGAIYSGQLFNKLNLYSLFAFHNYRDKNTEQGQLTGGQLIQIYPEVSFPFIGNSIVLTGGVFYEYWKFNQPDIFETKNKTMDYKLFSQVSFSLSGSNTVAVLFEFVEPHTSGVDFTNTYYNESEDFHYSIMPRFINNFLENVSMETYFKYSTWGPTYNNPETTYAENVEYILGTSLRGYF